MLGDPNINFERPYCIAYTGIIECHFIILFFNKKHKIKCFLFFYSFIWLIFYFPWGIGIGVWLLWLRALFINNRAVFITIVS